VTEAETAADRRWLDSTWLFVRRHLPPPPGRVLEIGCGPLGGHVPALRAAGYQAEGIDPEAPDGESYHQMPFEEYAADGTAKAIVASLSLHHVADVDAVVDLVERCVEPGGVLIVLEWARERFDEATAQWCFDRLTGEEEGWLHRRRTEWLASGLTWDDFVESWARAEGMHTGEEIRQALASRFETQHLAFGPYFYPDLEGITAGDEQAAIDAGVIRANGITYVGRVPVHSD
jgi:SAM-dependent methyltransferase